VNAQKPPTQHASTQPIELTLKSGQLPESKVKLDTAELQVRACIMIKVSVGLWNAIASNHNALDDRPAESRSDLSFALSNSSLAIESNRSSDKDRHSIADQ
jgi:hypothetical protein